MQDNRILVKSETLEALKVLKKTYRCSSYDSLINRLISVGKTDDNLDTFSNKDLYNKFEGVISQTLRRIESVHKRNSFFEKEYFLKINDILNVVSSKEFGEKKEENYTPIDEQKVEIVNPIIDNNVNRDLEKKLNLLRAKLVKNDDVFVTTYSITLSETDYKKIFE